METKDTNVVVKTQQTNLDEDTLHTMTKDELDSYEQYNNDLLIKQKQHLNDQIKRHEQSSIAIQNDILYKNSNDTIKNNTIDIQSPLKTTQKIRFKTERNICKLKVNDIKKIRDGHNENYSDKEVISYDNLTKLYQLKKNELPRWYTMNEISKHNYKNDCWVVIFNKIYDISKLIEKESNNDITCLLCRPLIKYAGTDISHWFDKNEITLDTENDVKDNVFNVKKYVDPVSNRMVPYIPFGRFLHISPNNPTTKCVYNYDIEWFNDWKYVIGYRTFKSRKIDIVNTLTNEKNNIEVSSEETLNDIEKYHYLCINKHSKGYVWKYNNNVLDMNKTLQQNNINDDDILFDKLNIYHEYIPSIFLYFKDDLTVA